MSQKVIDDNSTYQKHSSSNVINEITLTKNKRVRLYDILLDFINKGGKIENFIIEKYDLYLNPNDKIHLMKLLEYLFLQPNIESTMRLYNRLYRNSLQDAIDSLIAVFNSINNPYLRDTIANTEIHREDAEIIIDAYYWSDGKSTPKYVTLERKAIVNNRDLVLHILHNQCSEIPVTSLELLHISEIPA